jgi:hypothetical protein
MSLNEIVEQYLDTKAMVSKLEKKLVKYKESMEKYLSSQGKTRVRTDKYVVESKEVTTHRISKANVPTEVWERWSKESSYSMLKISKMEGKVRKSL